MRFIVGPIDAPANSPNPRENIRPQSILEAVFLLPAKLTARSEPSETKSKQGKTISVGFELEPSCGRQRSGSPQAKSCAKSKDQSAGGESGIRTHGTR